MPKRDGSCAGYSSTNVSLGVVANKGVPLHCCCRRGNVEREKWRVECWLVRKFPTIGIGTLSVNHRQRCRLYLRERSIKTDQRWTETQLNEIEKVVNQRSVFSKLNSTFHYHHPTRNFAPRRVERQSQEPRLRSI